MFFFKNKPQSTTRDKPPNLKLSRVCIKMKKMIAKYCQPQKAIRKTLYCIVIVRTYITGK